MEPDRRQLLRAWIEAILHHAFVRVPVEEQKLFISSEFEKLEQDFGVKISIDEEWCVEIDYLGCTHSNGHHNGNNSNGAS